MLNQPNLGMTIDYGEVGALTMEDGRARILVGKYFLLLVRNCQDVCMLVLSLSFLLQHFSRVMVTIFAAHTP